MRVVVQTEIPTFKYAEKGSAFKTDSYGAWPLFS
jgi:hypothetical protein